MISNDKFQRVTLRIAITVLTIAFVFYAWRFIKNADKQNTAKYTYERTLSFEGVISDYSTDIGEETSTFFLDNLTKITIPRNSKEHGLHDGDTIIKLAEKNTYIIRWNNGWNGNSHRSIDTINFECPR